MNFYPNAFKTFRESRGLTHLDIAKRLNIKKQSVEHWEKSRAKPRPHRVYELAKILGCSVIDISDLKSEDFLVDSCKMTIGEDEQGKCLISQDDVQLQAFHKIWTKLTIKQRGDLLTSAIEMQAENQEKFTDQNSHYSKQKIS